MKMTDSDNILTPPALFRTLVAGFDTITNHISLILFPIGLDLLIWLGPRFRLKELIEPLVRDLVDQSLSVAPDMETAQMLKSAEELWTLAAEHFNLLAALRSYPVGIPSLMTSILPLEAPFGRPAFLEFNSLLSSLGIFILLTLIGLVAGTLFFHSVAQAAISNEIRWGQVLRDWPWLSLQVIGLALGWFVLLAAVSVPAACVISFAALGSVAVGQCVVLLYTGFLIWILFPLLFSAHGIFVNRQKVWPSIKQGIHITRLTLPTTSLFFLSVILLTQGLDMLWRIPSENSWLMLLGLVGHAFVTTGLLSASFIYYYDADKWIRSLQSLDPQNTTSQAT